MVDNIGWFISCFGWFICFLLLAELKELLTLRKSSKLKGLKRTFTTSLTVLGPCSGFKPINVKKKTKKNKVYLSPCTKSRVSTLCTLSKIKPSVMWKWSYSIWCNLFSVSFQFSFGHSFIQSLGMLLRRDWPSCILIKFCNFLCLD